MFSDKVPIRWRHDPPRLIARKLVRALTASRLGLWSLEQAANALEKHNKDSSRLPTLYRVVVGAYIYRGYRQGLAEFGQIDEVKEPLRAS
jgi:hypothetical protein